MGERRVQAKKGMNEMQLETGEAWVALGIAGASSWARR